MLCSEYRQLISARLDNEISSQDELMLADHLKNCNECFGFEKGLIELKARFVSKPKIEIPADLELAILKQTIYKQPRRKSIFGIMRGYYKIPRGLAWASALIFLALLTNAIINPFHRGLIEKSVGTESKESGVLRKITLNENDVTTYTIVGKRNGS